MTTASTIIADALSEIGVIGAADVPSAEDAQFSLRKLNQILERWSNTALAFPVTRTITVPLTSSETYTLGPATGGVRPIRIEHATATDGSGLEYKVHVITRADWDSIGFKAVEGGPPEYVWHEATNTNSVLHVYPRAPGYTLRLACLTKLASFANTAAVLELPEGYSLALTLALAIEAAPSFGRSATQDTRRALAASMAGLRATNAEPVYLDIGNRAREFEIERGY
jgi:hypothetical protein